MVKLEIDIEAYRLLAGDRATGTICQCREHATPRGEARLTRVLNRRSLMLSIMESNSEIQAFFLEYITGFMS